MVAKVFVSHKNIDAAIAGMVAARLKLHGLDVYLDVIDQALKREGEDLAEYIRERLSECTQLMAVVSPETQASWWVPWEIGVATEKSYPLATYATGQATLPEYLRKWPYLRTLQDVDSYAEESKNRERRVLVAEGRDGIFRRDAIHKSEFRTFHRALKARLGQI